MPDGNLHEQIERNYEDIEQLLLSMGNSLGQSTPREIERIIKAVLGLLDETKWILTER